jgi:phytoene dehydrogenase-like protein
VLARFGLEHVAPLRLFCDAVCQITVQCPAHEAEAPFALATLDYFFRGVAHVHGGIGELARAIVGALTRRGAEVRYHCPVRALTRDGERWHVDTRRGPVRARAVVANLLPQALLRLLPSRAPRRRRCSGSRVRSRPGGAPRCCTWWSARPATAPRPTRITSS